MTRNACIYANRSVRRWLKAKALKRISTIEQPRDDGFWFLPPDRLTFKVAGTQIVLHAQYDFQDEGKFADHIRGFKGWSSSIHEKSPNFDLTFFHSYLDQVNQSYGVEADKEFSIDSQVMKALLRVADAVGGYLFVHSSIIHPSGDVMFGLLAELHGDPENA